MILSLIAIAAKLAHGAELTFELKDHEEQCYFEELAAGENSIVEFQVVSGGKKDVDVVLFNPDDVAVYRKDRGEYDQYSFISDLDGNYKLCFSNKMSTISHKVVYLDWTVGVEVDELDGLFDEPSDEDPVPAMSIANQNINDRLKKVRDYQTHHRLREASGRVFVEGLHTKVNFWGFVQTLIMVFVSIAHVLILRGFFVDRPVRHKAST